MNFCWDSHGQLDENDTGGNLIWVSESDDGTSDTGGQRKGPESQKQMKGEQQLIISCLNTDALSTKIILSTLWYPLGWFHFNSDSG